MVRISDFNYFLLEVRSSEEAAEFWDTHRITD